MSVHVQLAVGLREARIVRVNKVIVCNGYFLLAKKTHTKVQTLGIPTRMRDISTDDVLCRRLHINLKKSVGSVVQKL